MKTDIKPQDILDFWFSDHTKKKWYAKDPAFDEEIRQKFLSIYEQKENINWEDSPESSLAKVILFDQFSRNMFRDTPQAFATDELARSVAREAIKKGYDLQVSEEQRGSFYMPFMHSEEQEDQAYCVELFTKQGNEKSLNYAERHKKIIDRFGRFPHRNKVLGRECTPEEEAFLTEPGSSF